MTRSSQTSETIEQLLIFASPQIKCEAQVLLQGQGQAQSANSNGDDPFQAFQSSKQSPGASEQSGITSPTPPRLREHYVIQRRHDIIPSIDVETRCLQTHTFSPLRTPLPIAVPETTPDIKSPSDLFSKLIVQPDLVIESRVDPAGGNVEQAAEHPVQHLDGDGDGEVDRAESDPFRAMTRRSLGSGSGAGRGNAGGSLPVIIADSNIDEDVSTWASFPQVEDEDKDEDEGESEGEVGAVCVANSCPIKTCSREPSTGPE